MECKGNINILKAKSKKQKNEKYFNSLVLPVYICFSGRQRYAHLSIKN
jgi:hypothetical protein